MAIADTSRSVLRYVAESTLGTTPASALTEVRQTSNSLARNQSYATSQEIRSDRNIRDSILVDMEPSGDFNFELSYGDFDTFLEGAMFSTYSTAKSVAGTDISAVNATNSYASSSTDFTTENISVGDWIKVAGFTTSGNNGFAKVTAVAANLLTVSGLTLTDEAAGDSVTMTGSSLRNGTTLKSFTMENEFTDITQFISFTGMVVSTAALNLAVGSILNGTFSFIGMDSAIAGSTVGTGSAVAASSNDVMNSVADISNIRENGALMSTSGIYVLSAAINVDNGIRGQKAIGNLGNIGIGKGRCNVTGSLEVYFSDAALYNKFINNTATSIDFRVTDGTNTYIIDIPNLKFQNGDPTVSGIDADVVLPLDFQALYDATDGCTLSIHKF